MLVDSTDVDGSIEVDSLVETSVVDVDVLSPDVRPEPEVGVSLVLVVPDVSGEFVVPDVSVVSDVVGTAVVSVVPAVSVTVSSSITQNSGLYFPQCS